MTSTAYLTDLVKYCYLDKACLEGKFADDCLGEFSTDVIYKDKKIPITVEITKKDLEKFESVKQLQFPH